MESIWTMVLHLWSMFAGGTAPASAALQADGLTPVIAAGTYDGLFPKIWDFMLSNPLLLMGLAIFVFGVVFFIGRKGVGMLRHAFK